MKLLLVAVLALSALVAVRGDSPLTSINLNAGYEADPAYTSVVGAPEDKVAAALLSAKDLGLAAALVTSLGWDSLGGRGGKVLSQLEAAPGNSVQKNFAAGFLKAQINYLDDEKVKQAAAQLKTAVEQSKANGGKASLAVHTAWVMAESQVAMSVNWCEIGAKATQLRADATNAGKFNIDLKQPAINSALEYLGLYNMPECKQGQQQGAGSVSSQVAEILQSSAKWVGCTRWTTVPNKVAVASGKVQKPQYYFNLRAGPNAALAKIVLTSEGYASQGNAKRGYEALLKSVTSTIGYKCLDSNAGNQKGKWRLQVSSISNGKITGMGEGYTSRDGCENAGKAVLETIKLLGTKPFEACTERKARA